MQLVVPKRAFKIAGAAGTLVETPYNNPRFVERGYADEQITDQATEL